MNRNLLGLALVAGGIGAGLGRAFWPAASNGVLPYADAAITAQGHDIYAEYCAGCHGAELKGAPDWRRRDADGYLPAPPHDRSGHTWHHPDRQLLEITRRGSQAIVGGGYRSRMTGFGDILSDSQTIAVLAYIKSTWPPRVIDRHNGVNANAVLSN